jgi:formamidopyrimidine-DNA glycosylase
MGTLTRGLMNNQKKVDWFSGLTDEKRKNLLLKHKIDRKIEDETLLNEDVILIYDREHEVCESCEKECEADDMRMDQEDGNWFCKTCINEMD